mmetsp:Transcript_37791/g.97512  ORF Transcript_37791/g.97512 Transcript_37791/m.97512 type:complete len:122 (-) Transcript_37791:1473-1838(-)
MASRVVFVAALLLALVASAKAGGCAPVDITNFRACGPFLVEHAISQGTTDVPHLDYMKFSSGDAQAEFTNLDEQVYNGRALLSTTSATGLYLCCFLRFPSLPTCIYDRVLQRERQNEHHCF